jgi:hypothetical protein
MKIITAIIKTNIRSIQVTKNRKEAGQIAVKCVIDKLTERNYKIISRNNTTLSVESPGGIFFILKVTSLSGRNAWIIPDTKAQTSYFILVLKPAAELPAFFVLKPDEMMKERSNHIKSRKKPINQYSNPELERQGLNFDQPFPYENRWDSLPK